MPSQQTLPDQPGSEAGFLMVDRSIERNTGPLEHRLYSASTSRTLRVAGVSISMGGNSLPHQIGGSAPLGAELLRSQDKPGNKEPLELQQEKRPNFDTKIELNENYSKGDENQNAMKDETSRSVSVRGLADLESGELDAPQTGGDDGASIAEKEVTQSKKSSEHATDTFLNQQQVVKGTGAQQKADTVISGQERPPLPPGQSASIWKVNTISQNPTSLSPHGSTAQKEANGHSAQVGNAYGNYCS